MTSDLFTVVWPVPNTTLSTLERFCMKMGGSVSHFSWALRVATSLPVRPPTRTSFFSFFSCYSRTFSKTRHWRSPRAHHHVVGMLGFMSDRNQPSLLAPCYSVLASISVFMALSTVFHSINPPDNSPFSHSVLPVLFLPYWSFQLYVSSWKSPSALI